MVSILKKRGADKKPRNITPTELKRHKILSLLEYGIKPGDICAKMGYSRDLVYTVYKLRKEGKSMALKYKGRKRTRRTPEFLRKMGQIFEEKPGQNYRKTARELGICDRTVRQSAKELGYKSYQHRFRALLTRQLKKKRHERSEELLEWLSSSDPSTVIIFSGIYPID